MLTRGLSPCALKLKLMETTVDAVTKKHQEEQIRKEEDNNK